MNFYFVFLFLKALFKFIRYFINILYRIYYIFTYKLLLYVNLIVNNKYWSIKYIHGEAY